MIGDELRDNIKKYKISHQDFFLNQAMTIQNCSDFSEFMTFLQSYLNVSLDIGINCLSFSINGKLFCTLTENNVYEYVNFDEDYHIFLSNLTSSIPWVYSQLHSLPTPYHEKSKIPFDILAAAAGFILNFNNLKLKTNTISSN